MLNELRRMNEVERQSLSTLIDSTQWHYAISTEMRDATVGGIYNLHMASVERLLKLDASARFLLIISQKHPSDYEYTSWPHGHGVIASQLSMKCLRACLKQNKKESVREITATTFQTLSERQNGWRDYVTRQALQETLLTNIN